MMFLSFENIFRISTKLTTFSRPEKSSASSMESKFAAVPSESLLQRNSTYIIQWIISYRVMIHNCLLSENKKILYTKSVKSLKPANQSGSTRSFDLTSGLLTRKTRVSCRLTTFVVIFLMGSFSISDCWSSDEWQGTGEMVVCILIFGLFKLCWKRLISSTGCSEFIHQYGSIALSQRSLAAQISNGELRHQYVVKFSKPLRACLLA